MDLNLRANLTPSLPRIAAKLCQSTACCGAIVAVRCAALIYGYAAMKFHSAEIHCAAVFCAAECELCVRCSAPLKTHRKRAKFNRSSSVKF